ncbi:MAG: hypothetical protein LBD65_04625 [Spirochaetaceae bacterium]|nr:hypothetical protein [Spirochaetaceae bacterium]
MNLKISGIITGTAFVLSLLIGLISGVGILALVRALIFAAVFFVISGGAYWLSLRFLPELFENPDRDDAPAPRAGSLVDISLGDDSGEDLAEAHAGEYVLEGEAAPFGISPSENPSGLDQKDNISYTNDGMMDENPEVEENGAGPVLPAGAPDLSDELPDLESLSSVFSSGGERRGELSEFMISADGLNGKKPGGNAKPGGLNNEFNVQDMASAIQTILKRE